MEWSSKIIHPEKVLFPQNNITKGDLLKYYKNIANHILPYIRNHPLTIHCFPHGIAEEGFYRQHAMENTPETCELKRKMGGTVKHILCSDVESLAYLVNQNTIEIHRWLSTVENPENPNILIIDIDSPNTRFDLACKAAKLLKIQLENRSFKPYVMTTGSVGLHIISYVQKMNYDQVRNMLHGITSTIAQEYPNEFSVDVRKRLRENLTYLDISHNSYGQAAIAPFSVRAKKNAPVAAPLNWKELDDSALTSNKFTINNIFEHLTNQKLVWL